MSLRTERIGEQLRAELARVLLEEATDPRLHLVTLTRIDVAPDLSHALVFWSALQKPDAEHAKAVAAGLESASSFLRRRLARVLPLRKMPELRFQHDPSFDLGGRTLALLNELAEARSSGPKGAADGEDGERDGEA